MGALRVSQIVVLEMGATLGLTASEVATRLRITEHSARRRLERLLISGHLEHDVDEDVYWLSGDGEQAEACDVLHDYGIKSDDRDAKISHGAAAQSFREVVQRIHQLQANEQQGEVG